MRPLDALTLAGGLARIKCEIANRKENTMINIQYIVQAQKEREERLKPTLIATPPKKTKANEKIAA